MTFSYKRKWQPRRDLFKQQIKKGHYFDVISSKTTIKQLSIIP
jgi:hypothetical protein